MVDKDVYTFNEISSQVKTRPYCCSQIKAYNEYFQVELSVGGEQSSEWCRSPTSQSTTPHPKDMKARPLSKSRGRIKKLRKSSSLGITIT